MVGLRDALVVAPAASFPFHHHAVDVVPAQQTGMLDEHARGLPVWQHHQQNPGDAALPAAPGDAATCQDCGNQAKKDCTHRRCRTCCKGRGFDCSTHVKSTWVPAARRRERHHQVGSTSASTSGSKKPRLAGAATSASNTTTSTSNNTSSSLQEAAAGRLPRNVRAPAVFRCVRVTSMEDGVDEYAYQAVVRIGGHVFKGFLYDQGAEDEGSSSRRSGNNDHDQPNPTTSVPNLSALHLGGGRPLGGTAFGTS